MMELEQALAEAQNGKKVRRAAWGEDYYLVCDAGTYKTWTKRITTYSYDLSILGSKDWLIYSDSQILSPMTFIQVVGYLQGGYKARLLSWPETTYISILDEQISLSIEEEINFIPSYSCLIAKDWEVVE